MGQKEKLIKKLKSRPKDFTFDEAEALLRYFTYSRSNKGRTSGSRVMFVSDEYAPILLHKPHPRRNCWIIKSSSSLKFWNRRV